MKISDLFSPANSLEELISEGTALSQGSLEIRDIHYRSDAVQPGDLFVAIPGLATDGHLFAKDAASRGAAFLVAERPVPEAGLPTVLVKDSRKALAALAAVFYGFPARDLTLIGITGTNGKSTTTHLLESILQKAGHNTGVMGTIDWHYPGYREKSSVTTPESRDLQARLAQMRDAGVSHVVMEVSSHAACLNRIAYAPFDLAVFTNLSQDHLDYHGSMEAYWQCKRGFLEDVLDGVHGKKNAQLVLNIDDPAGETLLNHCLPRTGGRRLISTGRHPDAVIRPGHTRFSLSGIRCTLATPEESFAISSPMAGAFNLENILSATGAAVALGIPGDRIKEALESPLSVPGRLERIPDTRGRFVFVDYAHTPDALQKALQTLKDAAEGRLIVVFGCGGNRDRSKRPLMGGLAASLADICILTSDNPRKEDPDVILQDILEGIPSRRDVFVEKDRRTAIFMAIHLAHPGDTILIAGKGHEDYQIIGDRVLRFDDRIVAREALASHD